VKVQHPIEVARRSVTYRPVGKMTMDERFNTAKPMARVIAELHNTYNRNTLVHCGNYQIAGLLLENLSSIDHIILQDRNHRKEDLMSWMEQDDTVFLSVNYEEGIDLKGEKFPMNVICKIPFPYLGDPWIKARNDLDGWQWYNLETAVAIMQACGRTTRSLDDYSETVILDSSFGGFYNKNRTLFADWFKSALIF
jgi:Rad3-related DNA helicase